MIAIYAELCAINGAATELCSYSSISRISSSNSTSAMAAVINEVLVAFDLVNKLLKLANVFGIRKYQALWSVGMLN